MFICLFIYLFIYLFTSFFNRIDLHPEGVRVATAQLGAKPLIFVWDSNTLVAHCVFKGYMSKGIAALAFNTSGDKLAAAAIDAQHEVAVYDVTAKSRLGGVIICKEKGGQEPIFDLRWKNDVVRSQGGVVAILRVNLLIRLDSRRSIA